MFKANHPHVSPDANQAPGALPNLDGWDTGELVGSFVGFLRRPKASGTGLTVQVFGENGDDADTITALHLTRYLDAPVQVTLWMVKDRNGRSMKRGQDYPKVAEFVGKVRRPAASNSGQVAQFFAENGSNADAVCVLNQTSYLDALVQVEIRKADPGMVPAATTTDLAALDQAAQRQTPAEIQVLKAQQKRASEGLRILRAQGFFYSEQVAQALGTSFTYETWLRQQSCCQPGTTVCLNSPVEAFRAPGGGPLDIIPLCREHASRWAQGEHGLLAGHPEGFLRTNRLTYLQRWTDTRLREELRVPAGFDPTPAAIYAWIIDRQVKYPLPAAFMGLMA